MVAWMLAHSASTQQGFAYGLAAAGAALVLGIVILAAMVWRHPHQG